MLKWRLWFKAQQAKKNAARMTFIPQIDVPDIFIEDDEERAKAEADASSSSTPTGSARMRPTLPRISTSNTTGTVLHTSLPAGSTLSPLSPSGGGSSAFLAAVDAHVSHHSWSGPSADLSAFDSFYGSTPFGNPPTHTRASSDEGHNRNNNDPFTFELHETRGASEGGGASAIRTSTSNINRDSNRRGSTATPISPAQVTEMLDHSVWMDSIRRSTTLRRGSQTDDSWGARGSGINHPGW